MTACAKLFTWKWLDFHTKARFVTEAKVNLGLGYSSMSCSGSLWLFLPFALEFARCPYRILQINYVDAKRSTTSGEGLKPEVRHSRTSRHSAHAQSQVWQTTTDKSLTNLIARVRNEFSAHVQKSDPAWGRDSWCWAKAEQKVEQGHLWGREWLFIRTCSHKREMIAV